MNKELINLSNLQRFLSKLNEKFALKKAMKGISEDAEGNIIIGEEGLVPTPNENSKGKFLRSDGEWALPSETAVYDSMTIEEGIAGVSEVDKVLNAKNLKQIVNSDGFLTSLDSSKLTGIINIENLPQGALERILIVSSKEERLTLLDTEVQLGDVVKESDTGLMYYVINTEKLNSEEGYTQFTAGTASSVPWSGVTDKPTIPTKTSDLTNDSGFAIDSDCVHKTGTETIEGTKKFTSDLVRKYTAVDITTTPTSDMYAHINFTDKNDKTVAYIQYAQRSNGVDYIGLRVRDKNSTTWGVQLNTNKEFMPLGNNSYSLGSANYKWSKVYSDDIVHTSGDEYINGIKTFTQGINIQKSDIDLTITPTSNKYSTYLFTDKNNNSLGVVQYAQRQTDVNDLDLYVYDKNSTAHGIQINTSNELLPIGGNYSLGSSSAKWANVYATTYYGNLVGGITLNQSSLKMTVKDSNSDTTRTNDVILANSSNTGYGINVAFGGSGNTVVGAGESYTAQLNELAGNSAENLYLIADNGIYFRPGANTFADAKTVTLNSSAELSGLAKITSTTFVGALTGNVTGNCSGSSSSCTGNANSATYATTQATSDNSTKIATTAWVRTYVNSVAGSNTVGSSVSAYWSNSSNVTATGNASATNGYYPAGYSEYITKTPTVGTIYSGAQLYTELNAYASAKGTVQSSGQYNTYITSVTAQATFSNPISSTGKYLCTTANTVRFRGYAPGGNSVGTASVVENTSTKSIFIRIE